MKKRNRRPPPPRPRLTEDEKAAHRAEIAADQLGVPRHPATPPVEPPEKVKRHVWKKDDEPAE